MPTGPAPCAVKESTTANGVPVRSMFARPEKPSGSHEKAVAYGIDRTADALGHGVDASEWHNRPDDRLKVSSAISTEKVSGLLLCGYGLTRILVYAVVTFVPGLAPPAAYSDTFSPAPVAGSEMY